MPVGCRGTPASLYASCRWQGVPSSDGPSAVCRDRGRLASRAVSTARISSTVLGGGPAGCGAGGEAPRLARSCVNSACEALTLSPVWFAVSAIDCVLFPTVRPRCRISRYCSPRIRGTQSAPRSGGKSVSRAPGSRLYRGKTDRGRFARRVPACTTPAFRQSGDASPGSPCTSSLPATLAHALAPRVCFDLGTAHLARGLGEAEHWQQICVPARGEPAASGLVTLGASPLLSLSLSFAEVSARP